MAQWVDATTVRGARAAGIACAVILVLLIVANVWLPEVIGTKVGEPDLSRMLLALVIGMPLTLGLALRDPVRNAGVLAAVGLGCGFLGAARAMNAFRGDQAITWPWYLGTILFFVVAIALVVTYTRLRRPHPIIVRVVIVATMLMPLVLWLYEQAVGRANARPL
jgi:hypothetical protein